MTFEQMGLLYIGVVSLIGAVLLAAIGIYASRNKPSYPTLDPRYPSSDILAKPFLECLSDVVVSMDVDTTRFVEFVWAHRSAHKKTDTAAFLYSILGSEKSPIERFTTLFDEYDLVGKFTSSIVFRGFLMDKKDPKTPRLAIGLTKYNPTEPYAIILVGEKALVEKWEKYFLETYQAPEIKKITIVTGVTKDGSLRTQTKLIEAGTMDVGYDDFYPSIEGGVVQLAKEFQASKANVLFLVGPTGTGKSTLIRTLILKMKLEYFGICNDQTALESPAITDWIANFQTPSMIALEDADNYVMSRKSGNKNMSALLNMVDGIIQEDRKIIISVNLENFNEVDSALVRAGRTFRVLQIGNLTIEQANRARAAVDKTPLPENDKLPTKISLADALNYDGRYNVHNTPKKSVGFAPV